MAKKLTGTVKFITADEPTLKNTFWLRNEWENIRNTKSKSAYLFIDEAQKITNWSEVIKDCWDEDTAMKRNIKVVLLGSAPLLIGKGLGESMAGRFEIIPVAHWHYMEMKEAFRWDLEKYIFFGGYPGAAKLYSDERRWRNYIKDSLIETTISRDILLHERLEKPALLRCIIDFIGKYNGQILSYQKMIGQLQDVGNTTTVAHYLNLLNKVWLVAGVEKFSGSYVRSRASSPKLIAYNTALMSALSGAGFSEARKNSELWGRFVESAVGAYLVNQARLEDFKVYYWRESDYEVDFVVEKKNKILAIEVKSGSKTNKFSGLENFMKNISPLKY